ncbi:MAG: hypothetical protein OHK0038_27890 [Flammeovirgaceae bacterium]
MKFLKNIICLFPLFVPLLLQAQQPKEHPKGHYVDSLNRYYQQASLPLYVYVSTSPNNAFTQLSPEDNDKKVNELKPIYLDGHGKHILRHVDALHGQVENFAVYADGIAPVSRVDFSVPNNNLKYFAHNTYYYGANLSVFLSSKDEMSGVEELYSSVNGQEFNPYTSVLRFDTEGEQHLQFYAVDKVGNSEKPQSYKFVVDLSAPSTFHHFIGINSQNIISLSTKIYLTYEDNLSGVAKTFYYFDNESPRIYLPNSNIEFSYLKDGEHTLYYYSIDQVSNQETTGSFTFYLDKTAPIMSADVLGDRFIVNDRVYFSGRTKLKLTAVDNKAGIKEVFYSVDNGKYEKYEEPFYLPNKSGLHIIKYFAVDNTGNEGAGNRNQRFDEYRHNVSQVYVDLTGPTLSFQFLGDKFQKGDTTFINSNTKIKLNATDPESGLQKITYSVDGQDGENYYNEPFSVTESGFHRLDYYGYDNVNNRNIATLNFAVDGEAPEIYLYFSVNPNKVENGLEVYPSYVTIFLAATDKQTGYENIRYSLNNSKEQVYTGMIQGLKAGKEYELEIQAEDKLGNKATKKVKFKTDKF